MDNKTLRDRVTERLVERYPETSRSVGDPRSTCPSGDDLAPVYREVETLNAFAAMHDASIVGLRDDVTRLQHEAADLRAEINALHTAERTPPSWRTVAAGALDGLAAMLRGSW